MSETKSCQFCGGEVAITAQKCKHCSEWLQGKPQDNVNVVIQNQGGSMAGQTSPKKKMIALLLLFIGCHRFYVGKIGSGILFICTAGLGFIWTVIDFLSIIGGNFKDNCGCPLRE